MAFKDYYNREKLLKKIILWRNEKLQDKQIVLFASFIVGLLTAVAAYILKSLIHAIQFLLTNHFKISQANFLYLIYPIVGILIAGLFVKYVVRDSISHGVTKILRAISQNKSYIKLHNTFTSIIASSITIGFGGSVGAEAPIVLTGSAIGSNLGRMLKLEPKYLMLLIGCGSAGAIAGIFKAPIAGVLFVVEVLLLDLTTFTILPLLISAITATTMSYLLMGMTPTFNFFYHVDFELSRIPYVLILGVFCGMTSLYFTRAMMAFENKISKYNYWTKFVIGAIILSILIFLFPPLYGEGYDTIEVLINNHMVHENVLDGSLFFNMKNSRPFIILFLVAILLTKVFASSATNSGGGTGGIFAPSLFLGAIAGYIFASTFNLINQNGYFNITLPESNFALMGMAGVMAGVMHAPLTGTFLIVELTGGYDLFLPILITSAFSYATIRIFEKHSIYSMRLAQKGNLLTHQKDKSVLTLMKLKDLIETNFFTARLNMTLGDLVHNVVSKSTRNVFPVLDDEDHFMGIVMIDNIKNIIFRPELYRRFKVKDLMTSPPTVLKVDMPMLEIMRIFESTKAWNLPVVNSDNIYLGFISKSAILDAYRDVLTEQFIDQ